MDSTFAHNETANVANFASEKGDDVKPDTEALSVFLEPAAQSRIM